jgi:hypothetical protein
MNKPKQTEYLQLKYMSFPPLPLTNIPKVPLPLNSSETSLPTHRQSMQPRQLVPRQHVVYVTHATQVEWEGGEGVPMNKGKGQGWMWMALFYFFFKLMN